MDEHGWAEVEGLINGILATGHKIDRQLLEEIVETDKKGRYSFNETKTLIRANQGHNIPVDVELKQINPPSLLYHGTAKRFLETIMQQGLKPIGRLYVHLSNDRETAERVRKRHGKPAVLEVATERMSRDGFCFYLSENGVYLAKSVPPEYLTQVLG